LTEWPRGYRKAHHTEIDSTNSEARRLADAGDAGAIWIVADRQTAGRGRRGRVWQTQQGNLATTLLIRPQGTQVAQLSFAAALAVSDMVGAFAPHAAIAVKWPNDVLAESRKIAGILLEAGPGWLAVGMGVNLAAAPEGTEFPATALADLGVTPPPPDAALAVIANRFAHWYDVWVENGFEPLRMAWLARAGGLGAPIRARLPHEERNGVFEGIDANGALLLNEQGLVRPISAGEVFF
jgi:BirA family biotin operon repressor/biotin-[acetyl-CoA-carboxylase] ligase